MNLLIKLEVWVFSPQFLHVSFPSQDDDDDDDDGDDDDGDDGDDDDDDDDDDLSPDPKGTRYSN